MLKITALITAARENSRLKELEAEKRQLELLGGQAFVLDIPVLEISSTEVRDRLKKGRDVSGCLIRKCCPIFGSMIYTANSHVLFAEKKGTEQQ